MHLQQLQWYLLPGMSHGQLPHCNLQVGSQEKWCMVLTVGKLSKSSPEWHLSWRNHICLIPFLNLLCLLHSQLSLIVMPPITTHKSISTSHQIDWLKWNSDWIILLKSNLLHITLVLACNGLCNFYNWQHCLYFSYASLLPLILQAYRTIPKTHSSLPSSTCAPVYSSAKLGLHITHSKKHFLDLTLPAHHMIYPIHGVFTIHKIWCQHDYNVLNSKHSVYVICQLSCKRGTVLFIAYQASALIRQYNK